MLVCKINPANFLTPDIDSLASLLTVWALNLITPQLMNGLPPNVKDKSN